MDRGLAAMTVSERFAQRVTGARFQDLSDAARTQAKIFILDSIGVAIADSSVERADGLLRIAAGWSDRREAQVGTFQSPVRARCSFHQRVADAQPGVMTACTSPYWFMPRHSWCLRRGRRHRPHSRPRRRHAEDCVRQAARSGQRHHAATSRGQSDAARAGRLQRALGDAFMRIRDAWLSLGFPSCSKVSSAICRCSRASGI